MSRSRIRQIAQHVEDLDRAVGFYVDVLQLELIAQFDPPGLAFLDTGSGRLLLEKGAPSALFYLDVEDVAAETERLRNAGVTIEAEPHVVFPDPQGLFGEPGQVEMLAFFRDSEGNLLGLSGRADAPGEAP